VLDSDSCNVNSRCADMCTDVEDTDWVSAERKAGISDEHTSLLNRFAKRAHFMLVVY
jgi:hypothetical protein